MPEWIEAVYRIRSDRHAVEARARSLAVEQSVEMPVEAIRDRYVLEEILGEVREMDLPRSLTAVFEAAAGPIHLGTASGNPFRPRMPRCRRCP